MNQPPAYKFLILAMVALFLSFVTPAHAVETIIVGEVFSELTGAPIEGVNVHFKGTKIGASTDATGTFVLRVDLRAKMQLVVSAVGYHSQRFEVLPGAVGGIQVALKEKVSMLEEVLAIPNNNPALALLKAVRANQANNDRALLPNLSSQSRRTRQLYVSNIGQRQLRRAIWRSLQEGLIRQEDSTYLLPLYSEQQTFRLQGRGMIPANDLQRRSLILSETDYSSLLSIHGNLNFYNTTIPLMEHPFVSPLAASGTTYYKYYLADSVSLPEGKHYILHFRTRNPFYPTFNGSLTIDSATCAVLDIEARVPAETNVNYLSSLTIRQHFAPDHSLASEDISALLDFAVKTDSTHRFPTVLITHSLTSNPASSVTEGDALSAGDGDPAVAAEQTSLSSADAFASLDSVPLVRVATWFATIALTGYIPTGTCVDVGHIQHILQVNDHEGVHIGLPLRTNEKLWKNVSLEAAIGYGFRDRRLKGLGRVSWLLPAPRRNILQAEYEDRYVWSEVDDFDQLMRENSMGLKTMDFTAYAFEALHRDSLYVNTAQRQRQFQLHWFADWSPNIETHAYIRVGNRSPLPVYDTPSALTHFQTFSAIARLSWGETKHDGYFRRLYTYSPIYPVLYLGAEVGHWSSLEQNGLYAHLRLMLTQHASLGMGGTLDYALQGGAVVGRVPAMFLWQASGNQGYAYDPYRYTHAHNGDVVGDKYLALQAEWNGQGILFNLIPGVRYLRLRELVETKLAYGYLSRTNRLDDRDAHSLYAEVGVGIGNILRICDLYSVWGFRPALPANASPLLSDPSSGSLKSYYWGIRFRLHLGL
ncbi:MAG: carboxypeptidase-like regulatory domain-containing protein [Paludibacteraceae bacterium]|nr:carboxypeptidase-like regulatory domain-containing protein [Paludibacteraceae bacterium]